MKPIFIYFTFFGMLLSCANDDITKEKTENGETKKDLIRKPYVNPNAIDTISAYNLYQIKKELTFSPGQKIDFRNFTYDECILRNGVSYIESDSGFDTTRLIKDYKITDSLYLVELYEYFGGGSSEVIKIIYLYKREPSSLIHLSTIVCSGNYPIIVNNRKLIVKADNYIGGESARCCPWKYEIAEFEITKDSLIYLSRKFEDIID